MFEIYKDAEKQWRWRFRASNGKVMADGGEGYRRRGAAVAAIEKLKDDFPRAEIVEKIG